MQFVSSTPDTTVESVKRLCKWHRDRTNVRSRGQTGEMTLAKKDKDIEIVPDESGPDYASEGDWVFRTQMKVADFFYAHWKKGLVVLLLSLGAVLGYGIWQDKVAAEQKQSAHKLHRIDVNLPVVDLTTILAGSAIDDPTDKERIKKLEGVAGLYSRDGAKMSGTAGAEAFLSAANLYLRAGVAWELAGKTDYATRSRQWAKEHFDKVLKRKKSGLFMVAALNGLASLAITSQNYPLAIEHYQRIADKDDGVFAQNALLAIAQTARTEGNFEKANSALDHLTARFPDTLLMTDVNWERTQISAKQIEE